MKYEWIKEIPDDELEELENSLRDVGGGRIKTLVTDRVWERLGQPITEWLKGSGDAVFSVHPDLVFLNVCPSAGWLGDALPLDLEKHRPVRSYGNSVECSCGYRGYPSPRVNVSGFYWWPLEDAPGAPNYLVCRKARFFDDPNHAPISYMKQDRKMRGEIRCICGITSEIHAKGDEDPEREVRRLPSQ